VTSIVEAAVPAEQLALGETLRAVPEARVDAVRAVAAGSSSVMPVLVFDGHHEDIDSALREDRSVESVSALATLEKECVYRVEWESDAEERLRTMFPDEGAVLRTRAADGKWCFRALFADRSPMEDWYHGCRDAGLDVDVESVHDPTESVRSRQHGLSRKQYVALETALQHGFYDIPRKVTLEELADEFDVSHQALSERLSRAHRSTIANVVAADFPVARVE
jgi:predicted DNA binding protein